MSIPTSMRFYRYSVESLDILFLGEKDPVTLTNNQINTVMINRNYEKDLFPIIRLSILVNTELYYKLIENKTTVRFRLRMQSFIKEDELAKPKSRKDYFNDTFCFFTDKDDPFLAKKTLQETRKNTSEEEPMQTKNNEFTCFLFKEKDIMNTKKMINTVLTETDMSNAIAYSLIKGGFNKVLMSPLDNKTRYEEVLIPPLTIMGGLRYLESHYGFYKNGSQIFFDTDVLYIIKKDSKCTAWRNGEYTQTTFTVRESTNSDGMSPGSYDKDTEKKHYINVPHNAIQISNTSVIADQIDGNSLYISDPRNATLTTIDSKSVQRGDGTYKLLTNKYSNSYADSAEAYRRNENGNIITVSLNDFNASAITPNKVFSFFFEDSSIQKKHGGNYRLVNSMMLFAKQGEEFSVSGTATFKKVNA